MITEIGITAGDIWHYLDEHQRCNLKEIAKGIGRSSEVVLMSIGWLAREGHIIVERKGANYEVWLRK